MLDQFQNMMANPQAMDMVFNMIVQKVAQAPGAPAPLSGAPWRRAPRVPAPPEVKAVVTAEKIFSAGSSPMPRSRAPPPLAEVGMPESSPRSRTLLEL